MGLEDTSASSTEFFCVSTVDGLSYTPSAQERSRDAAQIAATGRRSWKTLKGTGEAVWPPQLEAALIEALEKYQLDDSWMTKSPGRFPMRNRFISDYIYHTTGKRRSPKQVGSRLQQLKDTCRGKRMLDLIASQQNSNAHTRYQSSSPTPSTSNTDSGHSDTFSTASADTPSHPRPPKPQHNAVTVNILPEPVPWPASFPTVDFRDNKCSYIRLTSFPVDSGSTSLAWSQSDESNPGLESANPTVIISSPHVLYPNASFSVYQDGENEAIHTEVCQLTCLSSQSESVWLYTSTLVPGFWNILSHDPSRYTIKQDIFSISDHGASIDSIMYTFSPSPARPRRPSQHNLLVLSPQSIGSSQDLPPISLPQPISLTHTQQNQMLNHLNTAQSPHTPSHFQPCYNKPHARTCSLDTITQDDFAPLLAEVPKHPCNSSPNELSISGHQTFFGDNSCNAEQRWPSEMSSVFDYMTNCVRRNTS